MLPGRNRSNCRNKWLRTQSASVRANKSSWTDEEDTLLKKIVQGYGTKHWTEVAALFNRSFSESPDKGRTRKQCRDRWLNYLNPGINKFVSYLILFPRRAEITQAEELRLFCHWMQLGNKWVEIAKLMGRAENWVKNNWKKVLKREGIPLDDQLQLQHNVALLIARLNTTTGSLASGGGEEPKYDGSLQDVDVADELAVSDSEVSKTVGISDMVSELEPSEPEGGLRESASPGASPFAQQQPFGFGSDVIGLEYRLGAAEEPKAVEENKEGALNTESAEYDFAQNTSERQLESQLMEFDVPDIQRYTNTGHEKSPFAMYNKRDII